MKINELESFLSSISATLRELEAKYKGKLFPEKLTFTDSGECSKVNYPRFVGQVFGLPVEIDLSAAKKNRKEGDLLQYFSPVLKIYIKLNATPTVLLVSPETRNIIDQISKKLGFLQDIHINDAELDDRFIIQSDKPEEIINLFSRQEIKGAFRKLDLFSRLEIRDSSLLFIDRPFEEEKFSGEYLKKTLNFLVTIINEYSSLSG